MRITFLGTGTAQGIPVINCSCSVCKSENPLNNRLRTSILIQTKQTSILIDTTPDLRQQMLRHPVDRIDAVLYTHSHADHIYGLDTLRRYNQIQNERIPTYANLATMQRLKKIFDYAFGERELNLGLPNLSSNYINGVFSINELEITPIDLFHGNQTILGFRIGDFAYCTDVSSIPEQSYTKLQNLKTLVLNALREQEHPTHLSLDQAIDESKKINAENTYLIHLSHKIDHDKHGSRLPESIYLAYDGLVLEI